MLAIAATPQLVAAYMADASAKWSSDEYRDAFVYEAQQLESAGEAKVELSPLVRQLDGTDKHMSALDVKFVHEGKPVTIDLERFQPSEPAEDPSIDAIMRRAAVIEAHERHQEIKDGLAGPERINEIAAQDLEAYSVVVGYPEQAELANSMGQMQHNSEYKVFMSDNAPTSFAASFAAAAPQPAPDLSIKPKGPDMEM